LFECRHSLIARKALVARRWSITNRAERCQPQGVALVYGYLRRLFVESCPACGGRSSGGFCEFCAATFARVPDPCARCGLARPVDHCPLARGPWHVDAVLAPFSYAPPLDHYVHALKYRGSRTLGRAFALLIVPALVALRGHVDALVAVPLHRTRRCERGYNQAQELARTLARELELPALERGITRHSATPTQTRQGAGERLASVAHAFRVNRNLAGQRIAIVDDVVTTGATVNALAAELRAAGAVRCCVIAVARTPVGLPRRGSREPAQGRNV
jgi:ComF family protein